MFAYRKNPGSNGLAALIATAALVLAACSGGGGGPAGATGATGASGSPGAGGSILTQDISTAESVTGRISGLAMTGGALTVYFDLVDQKGQPLRGLKEIGRAHV